MIKIPTQNKWFQSNNLDTYGSFVSSFNLNLTSNGGKVRTTRSLIVASSNDDGNANYENGIGLAVAFRYYGSGYYAATDGTISSCGTSRTSKWGLVSTTGKPTTVSTRYSDMEIFNECLYVTTTSTHILYKYDGANWSNITVTGESSAGAPHMMCVYANKLYLVADGGKIQSINTSDTSSGTIGSASGTLSLLTPTSNTITFLRATSN